MLPRTLAVLLAFTAAPALANPGSADTGAATQAAPNLQIQDAGITRVTGTQLELGLGLYTQGERSRHPVQVWFVEGNQRTKLYDGQGTFAATRGGFRHAVTVDVRGRDLRRGRIEVIAPECGGRACSKRVALPGAGANLKFDGVDEIERIGTQSRLTLQVANTGSVASTPCKLQIKVGSRRIATVAVPAIGAGARQALTFSYPSNLGGQRYRADLVCRDLVPADNDKEGRLR
ncbi:MAG: CARDB domain-containing protein [bacterium]